MPRKVRPNITPGDVGTFYTDGVVAYKLTDCAMEPIATMTGIATGDIYSKPISEFSGFVRLIPEYPIGPEKKVRGVEKAPRKPRKEKADIEAGEIQAGADKINAAGAKNALAKEAAKADEWRLNNGIPCPQCPKAERNACVKTGVNALGCYEAKTKK